MNGRHPIIALLLIFVLGLAASCSESIDTQVERRRASEKAFRSYADSVSKGFSKETIDGIGGSSNAIYMKWEKRGSTTLHPAATDLVKYYYSCYSLEDWLRSGEAAPLIDSNKDRNALTAAPVNSFVPGFAMALQRMVVGDEVRVAIPWYLSYGAQGRGRVPSFTALYYTIQLVSIEPAQ